ncbi:DUF819 domain-containing protein [Neptunicella sp. SCSIO 80796]|uniref:DUF819 family protein n=1 Tax=Neptunicella plasticusilytica TaxID=3117012 RepID=UPI003A4E0751
MPIISADNSMALLAVIMLIVAFGYRCEKTSLGSKISAPLIILVCGLILGNIGVLPNSAGLYDAVQSLLVPLAIPMLLFRADLARVFKESGTMLAAFGLATVFTVLGAFIGAWLVDLGELEAKIVGVLTSSYIGGSSNFVATSEAVQLTDSSVYLSTLAADALGAVVFLILLMSLPASALIRRLVPSAHMDTASRGEPVADDKQMDDGVATMSGVVNGIALSLCICVLGSALAGYIAIPGMFIISITILSLLAANFGKKMISKINFDFEIGTIFMYTFFATIGASANMSNLLGSALMMVLFLVVVILVHISLLLLFGWWFKLDLAELMIASSACILGPAAAAALAAGQGWRSLITSGMLVGVLGYAVATFIGISITGVLS